MGTMTRAQLLTQGGLASGNDEATNYVRNWMDNWLKRQAASWSWPRLKKRIGDVQCAAGAAGFTVGNGEGGVTEYIHKLLGETIMFRNAASTTRGKAYVRQLLDMDPDKDSYTNPAANRMGTPTTFQVQEGVDGPEDEGVLTILLDPVPNQTLYFTFMAHIIPAALGSTSAGDTGTPWYPADRTLEQVVKVAFMEQDDGAESKENYNNELARLEAMVVLDRDMYGSQAGDNVMVGLDPSVFR